jgi:hypothetical protein
MLLVNDNLYKQQLTFNSCYSGGYFINSAGANLSTFSLNHRFAIANRWSNEGEYILRLLLKRAQTICVRRHDAWRCPRMLVEKQSGRAFTLPLLYVMDMKYKVWYRQFGGTIPECFWNPRMIDIARIRDGCDD